MTSYNPPSEAITQFNSKLFNQPDETLSAGEISLLYLTKAAAATIYQTIAGMTAYLTTATAALTYQPISLMSNYLTTSAASSIYQTIANMTNYVSRTGSVSEDINGIKTFLSVPVCATNANTNNQLVNWQTLNGQNFTTLSLVQANTNTFTSNTNFTGSLLARTNLTLYELDNQYPTNDVIGLDFPMKQTTVFRVSSGTTTTIYLPKLSTNERGLIFTFIKYSSNATIIMRTVGGDNLYPLTNLTQSQQVNYELLSADKMITTLAVGFFELQTYWIEVSSYSTFDRDQNNLIYAKLASPNAFTSTNTFNSFLPTSTQTPFNLTDLTTKKYTDDTFLTQANATSIYQTISGMTAYLTTSLAASTYLTITNAASTYLSITNASSIYQTISGMSAYLTTSLASTTYLTITNAASTYLSITNAASTYLSITNAASIYQTISGMTAYLTTSLAASTYLTITNAASTYLTITNAASTYLTITNAASTYLTQANASSIYQTISGMSAYLTTSLASTTYLTITNAASTYLSITNAASTYLTQLNAASTYLTQANAITTYARLGSANEFTSTNQFNQPIKIQSTSDRFTEFDQNGINFHIYNRASGSATYIWNRASGSTTDSDIAKFEVSGISLGRTTGNNTIKGNTTFSQTASFSVIPTTTINANANNQLVNWQTLNGQDFTTLALVRSSANAFTSTNTFNSFLPTSTQTPFNLTDLTTKKYTDDTFLTISNASSTYLTQTNAINNYARLGSANTFTSTNQFNQPIKIQYASTQFTNLNQTAQSFSILNKSTGGDVIIQCRTSPGLVDTNVAIFNTTGITLGINTGTNSISGNTTFNQAVSVSGAASVTGLLTASGDLKTNSIVPLVGSGQNNIYTALPLSGTIVFGTASRTMNIYGNVNMVNSCQFSGFLLTNDISFASGQGGTAKNIYTGLTSNGSITIGATTANTTTNLRGGAINIGGSANILTIASPTTFNSTLKTDDITAISNTATQSIYTTLASTGAINLGATTAGTITNIYGGSINIGGSANNLTIASPTTFNNTLKTDDITAITLDGVQNIYTTLTSGGTINLGSNTTGTTTNIKGGTINLGSSNFTTNFDSTTNYFTSSGVLTIGTSVAPESFSFFSTLINTTINFFNGLTTGTINFCSSSTMSTMFNLNARVKLRTYKLIEELQTLTTTTETLGFPLQHTTVFTNTANITATLPEITNDAQLGLTFWFLNLGSITTTTTFAVTGTNNKIIPIGQMTQYTSFPIITETKTACSFVIAKLGSTYVWAESNF